MIALSVGALLAAQFFQSVDNTVQFLGDFRFQTIRKVEGERDWPFIAKEMRLACVMSLGQPIVYYFPPFDGKKHRPFVLTVDLVEMAVTNIGMTDVLAPYSSYEELIRRVAPFVAMGHMLCKQKNDRVVPGSEL